MATQSVSESRCGGLAGRVPRLRVLHVASQLAMGGMEKLLTEFARHADRRRFDLHFATLGGRGPLADDVESCGWPVTSLNTPDGLRPGLILRLARLARRTGADVVHTHNSKPLLYAAPAARLAGVPVVVHTRHGQRYGASRRATAGFRAATRLADRLVCVSRDGESLSLREGVAPHKVTTVHNGIDLARFPYQGPDPRGPVVMVGRMSPEKDVPTLLRAVAHAAVRDPGLSLEVAGDGPCLDSLRSLAVDLGLATRVRFLGEVRDVAGLLARARAFVLPSLTEGVSLTLLEAMARGLPVVATAVGGNTEVVAEGQTGHLVPPADPAAMAGAILAVGGDAELARRLGRAGRERVERYFDVGRMVRRYESLYEELAAR